MNAKSIFLSLFGLLILVILVLSWIKYNEGGPVPYPINTGSFFTIGSASTDPVILLENARNGEIPTLLNVKNDLPDDVNNPLPVIYIGWSQNDYLIAAQVLHQAIWTDNPNKWHLYRISFNTDCKNSDGKFENADLYYYQEVKIDGKRMYSVRNILIKPESGQIIWSGDSFYPRPLWGWQEVDLEKIKGFPAERALELADLQGGSEFRDKEDNVCRVSVSMWPWVDKRSDWKVSYSGTDYARIWIAP